MALDRAFQAHEAGLESGGFRRRLARGFGPCRREAFRDGLADHDDRRFGLGFVEAGVAKPLGSRIGVEGNGHGAKYAAAAGGARARSGACDGAYASDSDAPFRLRPRPWRL